MGALVFEGFLEVRGNREPLFSTSDRQYAFDMASVAKRASGGRGEVVMFIVEGGCILNEVLDWEHPDFPRDRLRLPLMSE